MKHKTIMSLAAVLPLAWNPTVGAADRPDAAAIKNPSTVVEHRGELRVFTPDRKRWQPSPPPLPLRFTSGRTQAIAFTGKTAPRCAPAITADR